MVKKEDFTKNIMKVMVHETLNVFSSFRSKSPATVEPLYRIAFATLPNSNTFLTIYDDKFRINKGFCELALKFAPKNFASKLENYASWKPAQSGDIFMVTEPFDVEEMMRGLKWGKVLNFLVDDTGMKSPALTDIGKSTLIYSSDQRLNNHSIILTNSNTGKSTTFENITGSEPATDVSEAGMFGSVEQSSKGQYRPIVGFLDGDGVAIFDEFPEYSYSVINRMLNYLESGRTSRMLVVPVDCVGSKTVVFLGNYENLHEREFIKSIIGLATGKTLDRVGRRFAHIIFDELNTLTKEPIDEQKMLECRMIVRYSVDYAKPKIDKVFAKSRAWMGVADDGYKKDVMEMVDLCKDDKAKNFLRGCSLQSPRLKCAAVKRAIIEHLDRLILLPFRDAYNKFIKPDILVFYEKFKRYNIESFYNFKYDRIVYFRKNYHDGMTEVELEVLAKKIGVSLRTLYRWKSVPEKRYNPWQGDEKNEEGGWKGDFPK
jgi:hypothetical protein